MVVVIVVVAATAVDVATTDAGASKDGHIGSFD